MSSHADQGRLRSPTNGPADCANCPQGDGAESSTARIAMNRARGLDAPGRRRTDRCRRHGRPCWPRQRPAFQTLAIALRAIRGPTWSSAPQSMQSVQSRARGRFKPAGGHLHRHLNGAPLIKINHAGANHAGSTGAHNIRRPEHTDAEPSRGPRRSPAKSSRSFRAGLAQNRSESRGKKHFSENPV